MWLSVGCAVAADSESAGGDSTEGGSETGDVDGTTTEGSSSGAIDPTMGGDAESDSTGVPSTCGDGIVEGEEACEPEPGDATCSADCLETFEVAWSVAIPATDLGQTFPHARMHGVAPDTMGGAFVVGAAGLLSGSRDLAVGRVDSGGPLWLRAPSGTGAVSNRGDLDFGSDAAVLPGGDLIASGQWLGGIWLTRYTPTGDEVWSVSGSTSGGLPYANPDYGNAASVAVDGAGNLTVVGDAYSGGLLSARVVQFDPGGMQRWAQWIAQTRGFGVAVGPDDSVYFAGGTIGPPSEAVIARYNPSGALLWLDNHVDPEAPFNAVDIDVSDAGHVGVLARRGGGYTWDDAGPGPSQPVVMALEEDGTLLWSVVEETAVATEDNDRALRTQCAVDSDGSIYVAGWIDNDPDTADYDNDAWVAKYDGAGERRWTYVRDGGAGGMDRAYGVAIDEAGDVLVAGTSSTTDGEVDAYVEKIHPVVGGSGD